MLCTRHVLILVQYVHVQMAASFPARPCTDLAPLLPEISSIYFCSSSSSSPCEASTRSTSSHLITHVLLLVPLRPISWRYGQTVVVWVWGLEIESPTSFLAVVAYPTISDASWGQTRWDSLGVDSAGFSRISKSESSNSNSSGSASLARLAGVLSVESHVCAILQGAHQAC